MPVFHALFRGKTALFRGELRVEVRGPVISAYDGLANRCAVSVNTESVTPSSDSTENLASCLALLNQKSPDLAMVVERWDDLPEPIQAGIVAMAKASGGDTPHG
jgi:hypothetical protein